MVGRPVAELGSLLLLDGGTNGGLVGRTKRRLRDLTSEKFVAGGRERDGTPIKVCPFERVRECEDGRCVVFETFRVRDKK